ncbi:hypothetical protein AAMO2058_000622000 [Amorphochlora amoebiformis]|mmetsp:Transcript_33029/g.53084  ORF Transcript_33029/g.53084 Transcript_33029/m.53084 type:complete len:526 (-) Transcript_33029:100-1677(-)
MAALRFAFVLTLPIGFGSSLVTHVTAPRPLFARQIQARTRTPLLPASSSRLKDIAQKTFDLPRQSVVQAVERRGGRVTASDAASAAGLKISEATRELNKLASFTSGALEVSKDGDIVYSFGPNVGQKLQAASAGAKAREVFQSVAPVLLQLTKIVFGIAIFVSIAVVFSAIGIILAGGAGGTRSSRDDDRRDDRSWGRNDFSYDRGGGFGGGGVNFNIFYGNPFDVFFYRPYGYYAPYGSGNEMGILESIFSYVFGDGDPNIDRPQESLKAASSVIRANDGVVTAEQLAPVLAPDKAPGSVDSEGFILDALVALNGRPEVTDEGDIVYVFPELQVSATGSRRPAKDPLVPRAFPEDEVEFSIAPKWKQFLAGGLGVVNLVGAIYLGILLRDPRLYYTVGPQFVAGISALFPGLLTYAVGFNLIPLVRSFLIKKENSEIEQRNFFRSVWEKETLKPEVQEKIVKARKYRVKRKVVDDDEIEFSSAKDLDLQLNENEMREWEEKLSRRDAPALRRWPIPTQDDANRG